MKLGVFDPKIDAPGKNNTLEYAHDFFTKEPNATEAVAMSIALTQFVPDFNSSSKLDSILSDISDQEIDQFLDGIDDQLLS